MSCETLYRINTERFAHETVDGEVIIIDMDEGNYFSMRGTSAVIWELITNNLSHSGIISALTSASHASNEDISKSVGAFMAQLVGEKILQEQSAESPDAIKTELASLDFQPPTFDKYTEMQDLLTLDPIHEVDETGWPNSTKAADR